MPLTRPTRLRRTGIAIAALATLALAAPALQAQDAPLELDLVLRGGTIYTGDDDRPITGDIGISGERLSIYFQPFTIADLRELTPEEITAVFNFDTPDGV